MPLPRRLLRSAGDDRLVQQLRGGNEAAFEAMYERYHRPLLGYCRHLVGSASEAEDAIQQVFAAAYRTVRENRERLELRPWLYTVARNTCISHLRGRRELCGEEVPATAPSPVAEAERRADVRALVNDIAALPEDQRSALVLSELGDLPHDEIASVVGCDRAKVKSLVHQARQRLFARRRARDASCDEVRDSLSTLHGGSLRRAWLKLHLRGCPGCREYREEVLRQRALMVLSIPVPSAGLRESVLAGAGGGTGAGGAGGVAAGGGASSAGGTSAAAVTGGAAGMGASASPGLLPALASSVAAKALVGVAIAGGAAGGGLAIQRAAGPSNEPAGSAGTPSERAIGEASTGVSGGSSPALEGGAESAAAAGEAPDEESGAYAEPAGSDTSAEAAPEEETATQEEDDVETEPPEDSEAEDEKGRSGTRGDQRGGRPAGAAASAPAEPADPSESEGLQVEADVDARRAEAISKRRAAQRRLEDAAP